MAKIQNTSVSAATQVENKKVKKQQQKKEQQVFKGNGNKQTVKKPNDSALKQEIYKKTGFQLKDTANRGKIIPLKVNGKVREYETVGTLTTGGRILVKERGKEVYHVVSHTKDNKLVMLKDDYAKNKIFYESTSSEHKVKYGKKNYVITNSKRDRHGRMSAIDENGKRVVLSSDGKELKTGYVEAEDQKDNMNDYIAKQTKGKSKAEADKIRQQILSGNSSYSNKGVLRFKASNGEVWYYDTKRKTYVKYAEKEAQAIIKDLDKGAKENWLLFRTGLGTDYELLKNTNAQIIDPEVLNKVNKHYSAEYGNKVDKNAQYGSGKYKTAYEAFLASEIGDDEVYQFNATLVKNNAITDQSRRNEILQTNLTKISGFGIEGIGVGVNKRANRMAAADAASTKEDYQALQDAAEEENKKKNYKPQFKGQDALQTYIYGVHDGDVQEIDDFNTTLIDPKEDMLDRDEIVRIKAETGVLWAKKGLYNKAFESQDSDVTKQMFALQSPNGKSALDAKLLKKQAAEKHQDDYLMMARPDLYSEDEIAEEVVKMLQGALASFKSAEDLSGPGVIRTDDTALQLQASTTRDFTTAENLISRAYSLISNNSILSKVKAKMGDDFNVLMKKEDAHFKTNSFKNVTSITDKQVTEYSDKEGKVKLTPEQIAHNKYVVTWLKSQLADLERDKKLNEAKDGWKQDFVNWHRETYSGYATRSSLANKYQLIKSNMARLEAAAEGKLVDASGKPVSFEDAMKNLGETGIQALEHANADYQTAQATGEFMVDMAVLALPLPKGFNAANTVIKMGNALYKVISKSDKACKVIKITQEAAKGSKIYEVVTNVATKNPKFVENARKVATIMDSSATGAMHMAGKTVVLDASNIATSREGFTSDRISEMNKKVESASLFGGMGGAIGGTTAVASEFVSSAGAKYAVHGVGLVADLMGAAGLMTAESHGETNFWDNLRCVNPDGSFNFEQASMTAMMIFGHLHGMSAVRGKVKPHVELQADGTFKAKLGDNVLTLNKDGIWSDSASGREFRLAENKNGKAELTELTKKEVAARHLEQPVTEEVRANSTRHSEAPAEESRGTSTQQIKSFKERINNAKTREELNAIRSEIKKTDLTVQERNELMKESLKVQREWGQAPERRQIVNMATEGEASVMGKPELTALRQEVGIKQSKPGLHFEGETNGANTIINEMKGNDTVNSYIVSRDVEGKAHIEYKVSYENGKATDVEIYNADGTIKELPAETKQAVLDELNKPAETDPVSHSEAPVEESQTPKTEEKTPVSNDKKSVIASESEAIQPKQKPTSAEVPKATAEQVAHEMDNFAIWSSNNFEQPVFIGRHSGEASNVAHFSMKYSVDTGKSVKYFPDKDISLIEYAKTKESSNRGGMFRIAVKGKVSEADAKALMEHLFDKGVIKRDANGYLLTESALERGNEQKIAEATAEFLVNKKLNSQNSTGNPELVSGIEQQVKHNVGEESQVKETSTVNDKKNVVENKGEGDKPVVEPQAKEPAEKPAEKPATGKTPEEAAAIYNEEMKTAGVTPVQQTKAQQLELERLQTLVQSNEGKVILADAMKDPNFGKPLSERVPDEGFKMTEDGRLQIEVDGVVYTQQNKGDFRLVSSDGKILEDCFGQEPKNPSATDNPNLTRLYRNGDGKIFGIENQYGAIDYSHTFPEYYPAGKPNTSLNLSLGRTTENYITTDNTGRVIYNYNPQLDAFGEYHSTTIQGRGRTMSDSNIVSDLNQAIQDVNLKNTTFSTKKGRQKAYEDVRIQIENAYKDNKLTGQDYENLVANLNAKAEKAGGLIVKETRYQQYVAKIAEAYETNRDLLSDKIDKVATKSDYDNMVVEINESFKSGKIDREAARVLNETLDAKGELIEGVETLSQKKAKIETQVREIETAQRIEEVEANSQHRAELLDEYLAEFGENLPSEIGTKEYYDEALSTIDRGVKSGLIEPQKAEVLRTQAKEQLAKLELESSQPATEPPVIVEESRGADSNQSANVEPKAGKKFKLSTDDIPTKLSDMQEFVEKNSLNALSFKVDDNTILYSIKNDETGGVMHVQFTDGKRSNMTIVKANKLQTYIEFAEDGVTPSKVRTDFIDNDKIYTRVEDRTTDQVTFEEPVVMNGERSPIGLAIKNDSPLVKRFNEGSIDLEGKFTPKEVNEGSGVKESLLERSEKSQVKAEPKFSESNINFSRTHEGFSQIEGNTKDVPDLRNFEGFLNSKDGIGVVYLKKANATAIVVKISGRVNDNYTIMIDGKIPEEQCRALVKSLKESGNNRFDRQQVADILNKQYEASEIAQAEAPVEKSQVKDTPATEPPVIASEGDAIQPKNRFTDKKKMSSEEILADETPINELNNSELESKINALSEERHTAKMKGDKKTVAELRKEIKNIKALATERGFKFDNQGKIVERPQEKVEVSSANQSATGNSGIGEKEIPKTEPEDGVTSPFKITADKIVVNGKEQPIPTFEEAQNTLKYYGGKEYSIEAGDGKQLILRYDDNGNFIGSTELINKNGSALKDTYRNADGTLDKTIDYLHTDDGTQVELHRDSNGKPTNINWKDNHITFDKEGKASYTINDKPGKPLEKPIEEIFKDSPELKPLLEKQGIELIEKKAEPTSHSERSEESLSKESLEKDIDALKQGDDISEYLGKLDEAKKQGILTEDEVVELTQKATEKVNEVVIPEIKIEYATEEDFPETPTKPKQLEKKTLEDILGDEQAPKTADEAKKYAEEHEDAEFVASDDPNICDMLFLDKDHDNIIYYNKDGVKAYREYNPSEAIERRDTSLYSDGTVESVETRTVDGNLKVEAYDPDGNLKRKELYDTDNGVWTAHQVYFDSEGNMIVARKVVLNKETKSWEPTAEYEYNAERNAFEQKNEKDEVVSTVKYDEATEHWAEFDAEGKAIHEIKKPESVVEPAPVEEHQGVTEIESSTGEPTPVGENSENNPASEKVEKRNSDGTKIPKKFRGRDDVTYDPMTKTYTERTEMYGVTTESIYDSKGRLLQEVEGNKTKYYNPKGEVIAEQEITDHGIKRTEKSKDYDLDVLLNSLGEGEKITIKYHEDKKGNTAEPEEFIYNKDSKVFENKGPEGTVFKTVEYDAKNHKWTIRDAKGKKLDSQNNMKESHIKRNIGIGAGVLALGGVAYGISKFVKSDDDKEVEQPAKPTAKPAPKKDTPAPKAETKVTLDGKEGTIAEDGTLTLDGKPYPKAEDGTYTIGDKKYKVEDGKLVEVVDTPDDNGETGGAAPETTDVTGTIGDKEYIIKDGKVSVDGEELTPDENGHYKIGDDKYKIEDGKLVKVEPEEPAKTDNTDAAQSDDSQTGGGNTGGSASGTTGSQGGGRTDGSASGTTGTQGGGRTGGSASGTTGSQGGGRTGGSTSGNTGATHHDTSRPVTTPRSEQSEESRRTGNTPVTGVTDPTEAQKQVAKTLQDEISSVSTEVHARAFVEKLESAVKTGQITPRQGDELMNLLQIHAETLNEAIKIQNEQDAIQKPEFGLGEVTIPQEPQRKEKREITPVERMELTKKIRNAKKREDIAEIQQEMRQYKVFPGRKNLRRAYKAKLRAIKHQDEPQKVEKYNEKFEKRMEKIENSKVYKNDKDQINRENFQEMKYLDDIIKRPKNFDDGTFNA